MTGAFGSSAVGVTDKLIRSSQEHQTVYPSDSREYLIRFTTLMSEGCPEMTTRDELEAIIELLSPAGASTLPFMVGGKTEVTAEGAKVDPEKETTLLTLFQSLGTSAANIFAIFLIQTAGQTLKPSN